jgi:NAD(P)H-hydrate epimerase
MLPRPLAFICSSVFKSAGLTLTFFSFNVLPTVTFSTIAKTALSCSFPPVENSFCHSSTRMKSSTKSDPVSIGDMRDSVTGYLSSNNASALDSDLMSHPGGFTLEQLMELAGLSVAEALYEVYPPNSSTTKTSVVVVCGPGNNGGDGLVAARHLAHFGYSILVVYPSLQKSILKNQHYANLVQQCKSMDISIVEVMPSKFSADVYIDALFGFSFQGEPREPYASIIMNHFVDSQIPVVSVDVPSGWDVDRGDVLGTGFMPNVLVSLTAPKISSKTFVGRHFIGRSFLKQKMILLCLSYNQCLPKHSFVHLSLVRLQVVAFCHLYWPKNTVLR